MWVPFSQAVAGMLVKKRSLREVNLRENELEDRGAIWIAKGLSELTQLEVVDLCQNQVQALSCSICFCFLHDGRIMIMKCQTRCRPLGVVAVLLFESWPQDDHALSWPLYWLGRS